MPDEEKVPEVRILIEYRTRRKGGTLFHIIAGKDFPLLILTEKDSVKLARKILKIAKEK